MHVGLLCAGAAGLWGSVGIADEEGQAGTPHTQAVLIPPQVKAFPSTLEQSTHVELKRGVSLERSSDAVAQARFTSKLPIGVRGSLIYVENVSVESGRVDAIAPKDSSAGVLLQGPGGVQAICAGGRLSMVVGADSVLVTALQGQALVGRDGVFKALSGNKVREFPNDTGTTTEHDRLPSPKASANGMSFSVSGEVAIRIQSSAVPNAQSYCGFLFDGEGVPLSQKCGQKEPGNIQLLAPHAGHFWAATSALDNDGISGAPSELVPVRVLGLSNGSLAMKNGVVLLGPGERAEIVGYEGLIMRYGSSPDFIAASSTVGIPGRKATTVEFRDPLHPSEFAVLSLSPRLLKSRISIGPALGTWPQNEVTIAVQMWDGDGRAIEDLGNYQIVTRVGLEVVNVDFTQHENRLLGTLAPRSGPGPWVVRVSILDSAGDEVSRDFLEVTTDSAATAPALNAQSTAPHLRVAPENNRTAQR